MKSFVIIFASLLLGLNASFASVDPDKKPTKFRILAISAADDSTVSTSNTIILFEPFSCEIPTAFTPNGDGLNDTFGVVAEGVKEYKMIVYNRFGDVVFTSNDINTRWNGTADGENAPSGSYVYQVYAEGHEGTGVDKSGKVMLIK